MHITVTFRVTDITPISLGITCHQVYAFLHQMGEKVFGKIIILMFGDMVEYLRFNDIDTGIDRITEDFTPTRFFKEFFNFSLFIGDHNAKLQRIVNRCQGNGQFGFFLSMIIKDLLEIKVGHQVTADNNKVIITDILLRELYGTCRSIIIVGDHIGDIDTKITSVPKMIFNDLGFEIE